MRLSLLHLLQVVFQLIVLSSCPQSGVDSLNDTFMYIQAHVDQWSRRPRRFLIVILFTAELNCTCPLTSSWLSSMKSNMWLSCILASCFPSSMAFSHIWEDKVHRSVKKGEDVKQRHKNKEARARLLPSGCRGCPRWNPHPAGLEGKHLQPAKRSEYRHNKETCGWCSSLGNFPWNFKMPTQRADFRELFW